MILCYFEKAAGRQYTKRMLPSFLEPFCVIRRDLALAAFNNFENNERLKTSNKEEIALRLGCIDLRTASRHMRLIAEKLHSTQNQICDFLSFHNNSIPHLKPGINSCNATLILIRQLKECSCAMVGNIFPSYFFTILNLMKHLDYYKYFSMTFVSSSKNFWDTS